MIDDILIYLCGLFWLLVYIQIIYNGINYELYEIPAISSGMNLAWETILIFILPYPYSICFYLALIIWWICNIFVCSIEVLVYPYRYQKIIFFLSFIGSIFWIYFITIFYSDYEGIYSAYIDNFIMSILYIIYSSKKNNTISLSIGLCKLLGTLFASIALYISRPLFYNNNILILSAILIFIFDAIYIYLISNNIKKSSKI